MGTLGIEDVGDHVPRAEGGDVAVFAEAWAIFQPFEDGDIWIRNVVVAMDALVVRKAAERFVVTGIREKHVIRDVGVGAFVAIAENLALLGDDLPDERHQDFAALVGGAAPVGFFQRGFIFHFAVLFVHQRFFGAVEDFLPAKTVGHDEDDVLRFVVGRDLGARGSRECERGRDREGKLDGESGESEKARNWQGRDLK